MLLLSNVIAKYVPALFSAARMTLTVVVILAAVLTFAASPACGQELKGVVPSVRPGDSIRVILVFDAPVDLSSAGVQFNIVKLTEQSQDLWIRTFNLTELKKVANKPNEYEISGTIPLFGASGSYRLTNAWAGVPSLGKNYSFPQSIHQEITITVVNDSRDPIPPLNDIKVAPKAVTP